MCEEAGCRSETNTSRRSIARACYEYEAAIVWVYSRQQSASRPVGKLEVFSA
jgi:hypothetical protein